MKNRLSTSARSGINVFITGEDSLGNKLEGKDRFGRPIPPRTAALNILQQIGAPIEPLSVEALVNYISGKQGLEETVSQAAGLPLNYRFPTKEAGGFKFRKPRKLSVR
jgi:hypothetical protein